MRKFGSEIEPEGLTATYSFACYSLPLQKPLCNFYERSLLNKNEKEMEELNSLTQMFSRSREEFSVCQIRTVVDPIISQANCKNCQCAALDKTELEHVIFQQPGDGKNPLLDVFWSTQSYPCIGYYTYDHEEDNTSLKSP